MVENKRFLLDLRKNLYCDLKYQGILKFIKINFRIHSNCNDENNLIFYFK